MELRNKGLLWGLLLKIGSQSHEEGKGAVDG